MIQPGQIVLSLITFDIESIVFIVNESGSCILDNETKNLSVVENSLTADEVEACKALALVAGPAFGTMCVPFSSNAED